MRIKDLPLTTSVSAADFLVVDQGTTNPVTRRATLASALGQNAQAEVLSAVSGTNTITATSAQSFTDYAAGQRFQFGTAGANTGAVTLNVNGRGAKAVVAVDGTALTAGALPAGTWVTVEYNGTAFTVLGYHVLRSSWGAGAVGNTPAGGIAATTVQGALNELDTEKISFTRLDDSDGSNLVGFLQAGTGAVSRTAQAKMRDVVSVKDFGAVGDGVTDDTAAIQAAVLAANGREIFFPAGTYLANNLNATTITSSFHIIGEQGKTIFKATSVVDGFTFGAAGIDVVFDGVAFDGYDRAVRGVDNGTKLASLEIRNCAFINCFVGARAIKVERFVFENNYVTGPSRLSTVSGTGISVQEPDSAKVLNNSFKFLSGYAVLLGSNDSTGLLTMRRMLVSGNNILSVNNTVSGGEAHGVLCYGEDITVANNFVEDVSNGGGTGAEGIYCKGRKVLISGNTLKDAGNSTEACITIKGDVQGTVPPLPGGQLSYDHVISQNFVELTRSVYPKGKAAIFSFQEHTMICNNYIVNGFIVVGKSPIVSGNVFRDSFPVFAGDLSGSVVIENNTAFGTAPDPAQLSAAESVFRLGVQDNVTQLNFKNNSVDLDMNGFAPATSFHVFRLLRTSTPAKSVEECMFYGNNVTLRNLTAPATSGPFLFSSSTFITHGNYRIFDNVLPLLNGATDFNRINAKATGNAFGLGHSATMVAPQLAPGAAGKVSLSNAIQVLVDRQIGSKAITADLWDLTAVSTGAAEYKKVLLQLTVGGVASIKVGAAAASEALAQVPLRTANLVAVGYVNIPPSYAGGAISASNIVPIVGNDAQYL